MSLHSPEPPEWIQRAPGRESATPKPSTTLLSCCCSALCPRGESRREPFLVVSSSSSPKIEIIEERGRTKICEGKMVRFWFREASMITNPVLMLSAGAVGPSNLEGTFTSCRTIVASNSPLYMYSKVWWGGTVDVVSDETTDPCVRGVKAGWNDVLEV